MRNHRPALDGIRALAIVLVMIYHATSQQPRGGFFSVDVFFVLSGYLIAGLLIKEDWTWGSIDLVAFYVRRARRLLPGLIAAVIAIAAICPRVLSDEAVASMRGDGLATIFYVANWRFIATGDSYFAQFGDPSPYRHMWTLAIEEQFYLILPMLLICLIALTRANLRYITGALVGLAALSALWMWTLYVPGQDPSRVYYGTDTRAQDLLLGSALACAMTLISKRAAATRARLMTVIGGIGFAVMVVWFLTFAEDQPFTYGGGFFIFVLGTCALIASVELNQDGPFARLFGFAPWAWIGKISYGLYLYHWPVFLVMKHTGLTGPVLFVTEFAISFALGALSFYALEQPIRRHGLKPLIGRRAAVTVGWLCLPVTAALTLALTPAVTPNLIVQAKPGQGSDMGTVNPNASLKVLVLGDSVGFSLGYAFDEKEWPKVQVTGDVIFGCGTAEQHIAVNGVDQKPDPSQCQDVFAKWPADVASKNPNVVLWSLGGWEVYDHVVDGKILKVGSPEYAAYLTSRLDLGLSKLGSTKVVIPNLACYSQPSYVVDGQDMAPNRNDPARATAVNNILDAFAASHPQQVHIFDVASKLCPDGKPILKVDGVQVRSDGVHYTIDGARLFWTWIMPTLEKDTGITVK
ncbi:hypothetical protein AZH51_08725 [Branchiibius sp. NY16-3462-2]|nr:hypothetical protein AZH51_08725 [Branchiibius sp. NY16-3462-2]